MMNINKWIGGCKVEAFPWVDGETIYVNVQYYQPGKSLHQPPLWDKTVYIASDAAGQRLVYEFTDTLVRYIENLKIPPHGKVIIRVEREPAHLTQ